MKLVKPKELFQKVYKSGSAEQGRLLGLDVGNKYVGLAISDACNKIASPAAQVKLFIEDLRKTGKLEGLSYTYWDENYTSKCVEALLAPLNFNPVLSKRILDKFAAVGILQGFLDNIHRESRSGDMSEE